MLLMVLLFTLQFYVVSKGRHQQQQHQKNIFFFTFYLYYSILHTDFRQDLVCICFWKGIKCTKKKPVCMLKMFNLWVCRWHNCPTMQCTGDGDTAHSFTANSSTCPFLYDAIVSLNTYFWLLVDVQMPLTVTWRPLLVKTSWQGEEIPTPL